MCIRDRGGVGLQSWRTNKREKLHTFWHKQQLKLQVIIYAKAKGLAFEKWATYLEAQSVNVKYGTNYRNFAVIFREQLAQMKSYSQQWRKRENLPSFFQTLVLRSPEHPLFGRSIWTNQRSRPSWDTPFSTLCLSHVGNLLLFLRLSHIPAIVFRSGRGGEAKIDKNGNEILKFWPSPDVTRKIWKYFHYFA